MNTIEKLLLKFWITAVVFLSFVTNVYNLFSHAYHQMNFIEIIGFIMGGVVIVLGCIVSGILLICFAVRYIHERRKMRIT